MNPESSPTSRALDTNHRVLQNAIRISLLALIGLVCFRIVAPFAAIMMWALILAVTLFPVATSIAPRVGGLSKASIVLAGLGVALIGIPCVLLGMSFADHANAMLSNLKAGTLTISPPADTVATWPIVGERLHGVWLEASENLPETIKQHEQTVRDALLRLLTLGGSVLASVGFFIGAFIIAGIMMAYGLKAHQGVRQITHAFAGTERGDEIHRLSIATIRSVALGVVGVAFIQALLLGMGFLVAGIPAAGILAVVTLIIGIVQLPALILTIPVLAWLWGVGDGGTAFNLVMSLYIVVAGLSDGVLKPMLLGRGVDVPMPVVLIGALGGMVSMGLLGLFVGAVVLSVGYRLFMSWVESEVPALPEQSTSSDS